MIYFSAEKLKTIPARLSSSHVSLNHTPINGVKYENIFCTIGKDFFHLLFLGGKRISTDIGTCRQNNISCQQMQLVSFAASCKHHQKSRYLLKPPDLSTVGSERTADWISKWITKQETLNGKKHSVEFKGKPEDLKTLSEWVASFKKP